MTKIENHHYIEQNHHYFLEKMKILLQVNAM